MESTQTAAMVITLIIAIIVGGTIVVNLGTDATLGATTAVVNPIINLGWVAFSIVGIGILAVVGKYIISIFQ